MARVYRQQYTKKIPKGAERTTKEIKSKNGTIRTVPAVRFKGRDGRTVVAPIVEEGKGAGTHCRVKSPCYYGRVNGKPVKLKKSKTESQDDLDNLIGKARSGELGVADKFVEHRAKPISDHLADFLKHLRERDRDERYIEQTESMIKAAMDGTRAVYLDDLDAAKVQTWLATLRESKQFALPSGTKEFAIKDAAAILGLKPASLAPLLKRHNLAATGNGKARRVSRAVLETLIAKKSRGIGPETVNHYVAALRTFTAWLTRPGKNQRMVSDPLVELEMLNTSTDRRHDRRELTPDELRKVLATAKVSTRTFRGLTGEDRYALYACACGSGFRASAMANLRPSDFSLSSEPPLVILPARLAKNKKVKIQPLPEEIAALLRVYLAGRPADVAMWAGTSVWSSEGKGAEMLRRDLADAGIPYEVPGPDGPLFADFHCLRHSFITIGSKAGIDDQTLRNLAGHSTVKLTERYTHKRLADLTDAVKKMPNILPEQER